MKNRYLLLIIFIGINAAAFAQVLDSASSLKFSGYLEIYYGYDPSSQDNHTRPGFMYSFNRNSEVNLNLGMIKAQFERNAVRANLALMAGTYANANLAAEQGVLKNVYEANIGFKVTPKKNLWIDAGIFGSHIGFESAIGKDCANLTRSIPAENSPYYESGVKATYITDNEKWLFSLLLLNGWQRIQRVDGNFMPAFGHQLVYKPGDKITLNSSSFIGSDSPDTSRVMRYFHNLYGIIQIANNFAVTAGFDIGAQQVNKGSSKYNIWYSPVIIARYTPMKKWALALRGEYYSDENQVIIATGTPNGFQTFGYSLNVDYTILDEIILRLEGRGFSSQDDIFLTESDAEKGYYLFTASVICSLHE